MGRESRQARRARERRAGSHSRRRQGLSASNRWSIIGGAAVIVAVIAVLGALAFTQGASSSATATPTVPAEIASQTIDNIDCNFSEQVTYHVHAHLDMFDAGKPVTVPAGIGINTDHDCLYWVHTHNPDGVLHVEAPRQIRPTLKNFFDIWHQPFNSRQIGPVTVKPGQTVKYFVNQKPYTGNPAAITLTRHKDIAIEIGPPFPKPQPYQYNGL